MEGRTEKEKRESTFLFSKSQSWTPWRTPLECPSQEVSTATSRVFQSVNVLLESNTEVKVSGITQLAILSVLFFQARMDTLTVSIPIVSSNTKTNTNSTHYWPSLSSHPQHSQTLPYHS
jgi:hypothetical protein